MVRSSEDVAKRVRDLLDVVQLSDQGDKYPPQVGFLGYSLGVMDFTSSKNLTTLGAFFLRLSGGQKQRVSLSRALETEPRLLHVDHPFGALDIIAKQELWSWERRLYGTLL